MLALPLHVAENGDIPTLAPRRRRIIVAAEARFDVKGQARPVLAHFGQGLRDGGRARVGCAGVAAGAGLGFGDVPVWAEQHCVGGYQRFDGGGGYVGGCEEG